MGGTTGTAGKIQSAQAKIATAKAAGDKKAAKRASATLKNRKAAYKARTGKNYRAPKS